eukprot:4138864-Amphidinium_carterae.1
MGRVGYAFSSMIPVYEGASKFSHNRPTEVKEAVCFCASAEPPISVLVDELLEPKQRDFLEARFEVVMVRGA